MSFATELFEQTKHLHLLNHPFYKAWDMGELDHETLKSYARQYFKHVDAFPRYISATHSRCEQLSARQVLLDNLKDEETGAENHPELWARFSDGLGNSREELGNDTCRPFTQRMIDTFMELSYSSYEEGLAALYIYEQQVPKICETKIKGLKDHYGVSDPRSLSYFTLHHEMDIIHSEETARLLEEIPANKRAAAKNAATRACEALWGFLDGMETERQNRLAN